MKNLMIDSAAALRSRSVSPILVPAGMSAALGWTRTVDRAFGPTPVGTAKQDRPPRGVPR